MESTYQSKDLSLSAFLYASGQKLIRLDNDNGRFWFVFEDEKTCQKLVDSFWRKEAHVNAKEFSDAIRTLKDLIFNKERK